MFKFNSKEAVPADDNKSTEVTDIKNAVIDALSKIQADGRVIIIQKLTINIALANGGNGKAVLTVD